MSGLLVRADATERALCIIRRRWVGAGLVRQLARRVAR